MHSVFFDAKVDDATRRARLYDGQLFVYSPRPNTVALCAFARELTEAAFAPFDPRDAQYHLPVDEYVAILARLKPQFINHPHSKELLQGVLREFGCDPAAARKTGCAAAASMAGCSQATRSVWRMSSRTASTSAGSPGRPSRRP